MNRRFVVLGVVGAMVVGLWLLKGRQPGRGAGPLAQAAYVWQRVWNEPMREALQVHTNFSELVILNAEVDWRSGSPQVVRVPLDYAWLRQLKTPLGIALRLGPFGGPLANHDETAPWLCSLAGALIQEAATNQIRVTELHLDFDCAESMLEGYRLWVEAVRRQIAPVPVVITALPAWLKQPAFKKLLATADGYVLQVHSLTRPRNANAPFSLCDPVAARQAVERAARLGKPFRVALPTYGYLLAFDGQDRFAGLSAEGPSRSWPESFQIREIRADPQALAGLVLGWTRDRPAALQGILWYRLPVAGDQLNWTMATLAKVMTGQTPQTAVKVETRQPQPGLVEADLVNVGQADFIGPAQVTLRWSRARLIASDGLRGIAVNENGTNAVEFASTPAFARLEPGGRRTLGWIRLDQMTEVTIETRIDAE